MSDREIVKVEKLNDLPADGRLFCGTPDDVPDHGVLITWFQAPNKIGGGKEWNLCRVIELQTN